MGPCPLWAPIWIELCEAPSRSESFRDGCGPWEYLRLEGRQLPPFRSPGFPCLWACSRGSLCIIPICCTGDASISHMVQTRLALVGRSSIEKTPELHPRSWERMGLSVGETPFWADSIWSHMKILHSAQEGYWTRVSCIAGGFFTIWASREAPLLPLAS